MKRNQYMSLGWRILGPVLVIVVVLVVGGLMGILLTAPIVGWPHAFPGLLLNAPEPIRTAVAWLLIGGTPALGLYFVWRRK